MIKTSIFIFLISVSLFAEVNLEKCYDMYYERDFKLALVCVSTKIKSFDDSESSLLLKAYELSAILNYMQEDYNKTNKYFDKILQTNINYSLNPVNVVPEIMALFKNRKDTFLEKNKILENKIVTKSLLRFIPFGIGHIKEKKYKRGVSYIVLSSLAIIANVGLYKYRKSIENSDGSYNNPDLAMNLYDSQRISFYGVFVGVGLVSLVDGLIFNR